MAVMLKHGLARNLENYALWKSASICGADKYLWSGYARDRGLIERWRGEGKGKGEEKDQSQALRRSWTRHHSDFMTENLED